MNLRHNGSTDDVRRRLEDAISAGTYPQGERIPSERTLSEEWGVDRRTVARAVAQLVASGKIRIEGRARVVVPNRAAEVGAVGLCMDNSVTEQDASNAIGTGRLLIGRGLMKRLAEADPKRTMLWCDGLTGDPFDNVPTPESLRESGISALAVWPTLPTSEVTIARLRELRGELPLVLLDRRVPGFESDFVGFADEEAGRLIASHALAAGHRSFAFYGWAVPETVHRRLRGVETTLMDAGCPLASKKVLLVRDDVGFEERFEPLLASAHRPTAVICANDLAAIALMSWLLGRGVAVPGEIAVLAIGNSFESVHSTLGLTTVAFSQEEVGRQAAELILARMQGSLDPREVIERRVPGRLVVRRSCGALSSVSDPIP